MNKLTFLADLKSEIANLAKDEIEDILRDYEEYFEIGKKEGKTEIEIINKLGTPKQIASELLNNYSYTKPSTTPTTNDKKYSVIACIGVILVNLIFILGPFLGILFTLVGFWIAAIVCVLIPIPALFTYEISKIFQSILVCGLGIFLGVGLYYVTNWLKIGLTKYIQFNLKLMEE